MERNADVLFFKVLSHCSFPWKKQVACFSYKLGEKVSSCKTNYVAFSQEGEGECEQEQLCE